MNCLPHFLHDKLTLFYISGWISTGISGVPGITFPSVRRVAITNKNAIRRHPKQSARSFA